MSNTTIAKTPVTPVWTAEAERVEELILAGKEVGFVSEDVLRVLAKSKDWYVRRAVASNQITPIDVIRVLAKDEAWEVRAVVASNRITPEDVLRMLAKDKNNYVRATVASNQITPEDVIRMLAIDADGFVSAIAARRLEELKGLRRE